MATQAYNSYKSNSNTDTLSKKTRVLLIDDDLDQLCIFEALLRKHNYSVVLAHSAKDGLNTLRDIVVDVVVCDACMPELDGKGFISLVRNLNGINTIPVIALTAGSYDLEYELTKAGASSFCHKTMARTRLANQIEEATTPTL